MKLFLLRHGIAVERSGHGTDRDRVLTPKGQRKLRDVAAAVEKQHISFDLILTSPYARAWQTAEAVAEQLGLASRVRRAECLAPEGTAEEVIGFLKAAQAQAKIVLLVGHEPNLSELVSLLITGDSGARIKLRKGSLCRLSTERLKLGTCAALDWLLTAKQMRAMGRPNVR